MTAERKESVPRLLTLGPAGTCHEFAAQQYIRFQQIEAEIGLVSDFRDAAHAVRSGEADFIVQNSAHPDVGFLTERYRTEIFVVDTFLCITKDLAVLKRVGVTSPRSLGLMPATKNYVDLSSFAEHSFETANPIVARGLLEGKYDAGITFREYALQNPEALEVVEVIGHIDTAWLVYGRQKRRYDTVIGLRDPSLFEKGPC